jgi:hypothetical protein
MQSDETTPEFEDAAIAMLRAEDPAPGEADPARRSAVRTRVFAEVYAGYDVSIEAPSAERRRRWRLVAGLAVCAGAAAALFLSLNGGSVGPTSSAYAQGAIAVAEQNPRLLLSEPGWTLSYADVQPDRAETRFTRDGVQIDVFWLRTQYYPFADPAHPALPSGSPYQLANVAARGQRAALASDPASDDFQLIFPPDGDHYVKIIAGASGSARLSQADFLGAVHSMQSADVDTWLAALPPDVVRPVDQAAVVDSMLDGIPVPGNVNVEALRAEDLAMDRYQLGARVTATVACGWLAQWAEARRSSDPASAAQAVDAMESSRRWPILQQMHKQGGWSRAVWETADRMKSDPQTLLALEEAYAAAPGAHGSVQPAYFQSLGCDGLPVG